MLNEIQPHTCPIQRPLVGVPGISGTILVGTILFSFPNTRPPTTSKITTTPQFFLSKFVRIPDYYLLNSCSYSYLFLIVENTDELTLTSQAKAINIF